MAGQEKVMGFADLEHFLKQQFPESNKVNILLEQISKSKVEMEKELGEENPFFYGAISGYMSSHPSKGIGDWVDSKGNVNVSQINTVAKIAKKQFETAKENEANNQQAQKDYQEQVLEQPEEVIKQEFAKIDYNHLTLDNLMYISKNISLFRDTSSYEDYTKVVKTIGGVLDIDTDITNWQILAKYMDENPNSQLTAEQNEIFKSVSKELLSEDGQSFDQDKMKILDNLIGSSLDYFSNELINGNSINQNKMKEYIKNLLKQHDVEFSESLQNKIVSSMKIFKELEGKSIEEQKEIIEQKIQEQNKLRQENVNKQEQIKVAKDSEKSIEQMQAENDSAMKSRFEKQHDFANEEQQSTLEEQEIDEEENPSMEDDFFAELEEYDVEHVNSVLEDLDEEQVEQTLEDLPEDQPQPELADEEVQNEATEEVQDERQEVEENIEEVEEKIQEEAKEEIPEEQYEAPTFEAEEKTGLAGLFSRIANSRAVKAVTNLFKPKEEQKKLNAPANQRVEDGVRFTDYVSKGSLPKNIMRDIAVSTVEAVTKFAKNISGRGKQDNQVINTPTVIKSEPTKAQTEKTVTQEQQQTLEKTETFNDTNKWAVSNEAIQRQEAINKAQERNNLSHVAAPKQEELQSEEDKSFEEI